MATELRPVRSGTDDLQINAALSDLSRSGGGVCHLLNGRYNLAAPLQVHDCEGITLEGEGVGTVVGMGGYCGFGIAVGMPGPGFPLAMRPASPLRTSSPKASVCTLGRAALGLTGHPLALGWVSPAGQFDYWAGGVYTWDLAFTLPAVPRQWAPVVGFADSDGTPAPWLIRYADGAIVLDIKCVGDGQWHRLAAPLKAGVNRVTWQVDLAGNRANVWADGALVARGWTAWSNGALASLALAMPPHDGVTALTVGYAGPRMDGFPGSITDVALHGLRVCRAPVYQFDNPAQTFATNPSLPLSDDNLYFAGSDQVVPAGSLVGLLPLDPEPAGSPTVAVSSYRGKAASWLTPNTTATAKRVVVQDLRLAGALQPCILAGRLSGLAVRRVVCDGASQSFGVVPLMVSYPITIDDCDFSGTDSAVVSYWQMIRSRNLTLSGTGRDGIRAVGGDLVWEGTRVWRVAANSETVWRSTGQDDGMNHVIRDALVDDEEGSAPSVAFVCAEQGAVQRDRLVIDGLNVSKLAKGAPMVRLIGRGVGGTTGRAPCHISARGLIGFGTVQVGLQVDGDPTWHGDVDLSMCYPAAVAGDAAALAEIKVTPPTPLYRAGPEPPVPATPTGA
jgi:hypothetical protein